MQRLRVVRRDAEIRLRALGLRHASHGRHDVRLRDGPFLGRGLTERTSHEPLGVAPREIDNREADELEAKKAMEGNARSSPHAGKANDRPRPVSAASITISAVSTTM